MAADGGTADHQRAQKEDTSPLTASMQLLFRSLHVKDALLLWAPVPVAPLPPPPAGGGKAGHIPSDLGCCPHRALHCGCETGAMAGEGIGWALPEKFEDGLLDENGQPLSKRSVSHY